MTQTTDTLLAFRIAYLRAVARSWEEEAYRELMLQKDNNLLDFLASPINRTLHFCNSWEFLKIKLSTDEDLTWKPELRQGWIGPNDCIVITLPSKPDQSHAVQAQALTDYYHYFPSILGKQKQTSAQEYSSEFSRTSGFDKNQSYDLGIGGTTFEHLGAFMLNVIDLTWTNEGFLNELLTAEKNATPVLSKYFGVSNPFNFNIIFKKDQSDIFRYDIEERIWNIDSNQHPVNITIWYPNKPVIEHQLGAAIAAYNTNGAQYPFSCS